MLGLLATRDALNDVLTCAVGWRRAPTVPRPVAGKSYVMRWECRIRTAEPAVAWTRESIEDVFFAWVCARMREAAHGEVIEYALGGVHWGGAAMLECVMYVHVACIMPPA